MDSTRWTLLALLPLLLVLTGCVADQVVYVDQHGNELAQDENGYPIIPGRATAVDTAQPPVMAFEEPEMPAPAVLVDQAPAATKPVKSKAPATASTDDLPAAPSDSGAIDLPPAPAGAASGTALLPKSKDKAPAKADSSSELGGAPAGG